MTTRCGFAAIIGAPNAGKSTLINALVGSKVAIVSPKVQTTRMPVRGIAMAGETQIVFVDTPGIFRPRRRLDRAMVSSAWAGAEDADALLLIVDAADLVVLLTPADVRSCAAAAATAQWLVATNPNVGLVVRGPSPGGLSSADVAQIVGLPPLAAMRTQPGMAAMLEHGGLRLRRRSPLASAARRVLTVLSHQPGVET